nr:MAG TPA: anaerobic ribonucleoside triphosphate reductase [Caudoviricetes sp.]
MVVIKRDGREADFDKGKIANAILKAFTEVEKLSAVGDKNEVPKKISTRLYNRYQRGNRAIFVEEIQDDVETELMKEGEFVVAKAYIKYRYEHELLRNASSLDGKILSIADNVNETVIQENSNKNPTILSTQRDYIAGEVSRDITDRLLMPDDIKQAHEEGVIHFHDSDYFVQHMMNCCLINLEDMLQNGTVISGTLIEKPHSFSTACNVATQIIAQVASNQYGGQSISLSHLAPFVEVSRQKIRKQVEAEFLKISSPDNFADPEKVISDLVEERVREEVKKGVQTIQYQVITLMTTNGQAPFITVFMYLNEVSDPQTKKDLAMIIEEVVRQRYQGVKNEKGVWTTPAFPKLIYVLEEDNITEDSPYWYLTQLCAKCSAKRLVPDYISEKKMCEYKLSKGEAEGNGDCYTCMGCRSFLTPDRSGNGWDNVANAGNYQPDKPKYYGRFNQGVVTINLPDVALSALKVWEATGDHNDIQNLYDTFWEIFDERLELCHKALQIRHERLSGTLSDASPIHWQYGALARLKKGETIDKLLHGGYSTISLGYAGLYECVMAMTGKSHTDPDGEPFALKVMQYMNDKCAAWKAAEDIDYSLYGTPIESTTYKFAKCLQKRFGVIEGITDKGYITNSYHVHVTEHINAFDKLRFESQFQKLSPGGAISYIEVANLSDNIPAVLTVLKYIYDNIMYAELNTKSDYCQVCGWDKEIEIVDDGRGKLIWKCPNCGNTDKSKMNIARRTCGYIGLNDWNQGRTQEIKERYVHLGGDE